MERWKLKIQNSIVLCGWFSPVFFFCSPKKYASNQINFGLREMNEKRKTATQQQGEEKKNHQKENKDNKI